MAAVCDTESIYQKLTEEEKQAFDQCIDYGQMKEAAEVLAEHEKRRKAGGTMKGYTINQTGDAEVDNVHHIVVVWNGNRYNVIFGQYMNGWFCSIPDWSIGCELSDPADTFWNKESLARQLKSKRAAEAIARAIAECAAMGE